MKCRSCNHKLPTRKGYQTLHCSECGHWNVEPSEGLVSTLDDGDEPEPRRFKTGPWDPVWGQNWRTKEFGMASQGLSLIAGVGGGGKSTLILQILEAFYETYQIQSLYIGVEEPKQQVRERGSRLGLKHMGKIIYVDMVRNPDSDLEIIHNKKAVIVVDSVSALASDNLDYTIKIAKAIKNVCCKNDLPGFLINHINKEGDIAGLEALKHWVDTTIVLSKYEKNSPVRELAAHKNRNGRETSMFLDMTDKGMVESKVNEELQETENDGEESEDEEGTEGEEESLF